jgi:hypothetical protein
VIRARAAVTSFGAVLVVVGLATPAAAGSEQPPPPSSSTTVVAPPSSVPASTPATVVEEAAPTPSTVPRAASGFVDLHKPEGDTWELRQVLTVLGLGIIALAALGYAYGRIRSIGPRHPGLARSVE